jgi:5-methyltetrahydropteroyltriglutamate--homocysteine methyltransferase
MSTTPILPIQEIGSLAKPLWRIKALSKDGQVTPHDIEEAVAFGNRIGVEETPRLAELLKQPAFTASEKTELKQISSLYGLRFLEHLGLDWVYDGEQLRTEMYDEAVRSISNTEKRGWVRSFDNRYYVKQAVTGAPKAESSYHLEEFKFLKKHARKPLKVPITGAYTLLDWSYNEAVARNGPEDWFGARGRSRRQEARRELGLKLARDVIRPNIKSLLEAGATRIQIDEPAATTVPEEVPLFVETFNESVKGLDGDFSIHICFSDYKLLFPHILDLKGCTEFAPEFANDDLWTRGQSKEDRPGYRTLDLFAEHGSPFRIGLGVTDIHTDRLETVGLIRDRIEHAAKILGDVEKVAVNPDCGLRTRAWDVSEAKLANIVKATHEVRKAYGQETVKAQR